MPLKANEPFTQWVSDVTMMLKFDRYAAAAAWVRWVTETTGANSDVRTQNRQISDGPGSSNG